LLFVPIQQSIEEDKVSIGDKILYFSNKLVCWKINHDNVATLPELTSDREEADKKLVACVRASQLPPSSTEMVRSPFGVTLACSLVTVFRTRRFRLTMAAERTGKLT
jgi:peroxiredoxin family protein